MKSGKLYIFTVLIGLLYAQNRSKWNNKVLEHNAYGYLKNIGIPEAEKIFIEENTQYFMPRIVGGETADVVQYNYQAGLIISIANISGVGLCGGSLISNTKVATAAHCWYDGLHQGTCMTVVLGSAKVFSGGTRIKTCKVYTHTGWDPVQASNDVAVVYLLNPVTFSKTIAPIALASKCANEDFVGKSVTASGFGKIGEQIPVADDQVLSKVNLIVISNEECSATYPGIILPSNICTSGNGTSGHVAICSGDSGGPLTIKKKGKNFLIGIASFGSPLGCDISSPNGYSRVSYFWDFFEKHMNEHMMNS